MEVLNVIYHCKPGMREEFLEAVMAEAIDLASRAEEGNIKYDYYRSAEDENELLLVERWKDETSLAIHSAQPHFTRIADLKEDYVDNTELFRYHAED